MEKVFKIIISKESEYGGCIITASMMIGYVVFGMIFLSKWGFPAILLLMISFIGVHIYYQQSRRSKATVRTDEQGFFLEILEKSQYLEVGTTRYEWKNLLEYGFFTSKARRSLCLNFMNGKDLDFYEPSVNSPFFRYLQKQFPEKEMGKGK